MQKLSCSDPLEIGKRSVSNRSRARARGGREYGVVRVVGDNLFGWVEAAHMWGAEVEMAVYRGHITTISLVMYFNYQTCVIAILL